MDTTLASDLDEPPRRAPSPAWPPSPARPPSPVWETTALLAEHGPLLVRIAASYARTRAEREDLEQEIAVAIFRAWPRFRGECAPRTFLLRIAHNQALTFAARRKLRATVPIEDDPPDERAGADDALDDARRRARLQRAIQALPIAQRQVVLLALEGLPHDEIAAVVGIGVNNVAVRLVRAKAALRALLDDELAGRKTTGGPR